MSKVEFLALLAQIILCSSLRADKNPSLSCQSKESLPVSVHLGKWSKESPKKPRRSTPPSPVLLLCRDAKNTCCHSVESFLDTKKH